MFLLFIIVTGTMCWFVYIVLLVASSAMCEGFRDGVSSNDENTKFAEYCQLEFFRPRCWKNEIIMMEEATYGRMEIGRCIEAEDDLAAFESNPRFIGCSVDVLDVLDRRCSGNASCDVSVTDSELEVKTRPCYKGLFMYLKVAYRCISVIDGDRSCIVPVSSQPQHLVPSPGGEAACGVRPQPWILEAQPGQRINISLIGFSVARNAQDDRLSRDHRTDNICEGEFRHGYVLDKIAKKNISLCSSVLTSKREIPLHLSGGNVVEVVLTKQVETGLHMENNKIVVRFEAVGCSDLIPPEDAWLKRTDDQAVIGCFSSRQTWLLKCEDQQWIGVLGNCSMVSMAESLQENTIEQDYQTLSIVAIGGFGLAICLLIICIGFVCVRKYSSGHKRHPRYGVSEKQPLESNIEYPQPLLFQTFDGASRSVGPTYAVYAGGDEVRCNGTYNGRDFIRSNGNFDGSTKDRNESSSAYFVLDAEAVAMEQNAPYQ